MDHPRPVPLVFSDLQDTPHAGLHRPATGPDSSPGVRHQRGRWARRLQLPQPPDALRRHRPRPAGRRHAEGAPPVGTHRPAAADRGQDFHCLGTALQHPCRALPARLAEQAQLPVCPRLVSLEGHHREQAHRPARQLAHHAPLQRQLRPLRPAADARRAEHEPPAADRHQRPRHPEDADPRHAERQHQAPVVQGALRPRHPGAVHEV